MTARRASANRNRVAVAAFLVLAAAAVVAGLDLKSQRDRAHLVAVAENTVDPDGLVRLSRGACPDATYLVRCGRSSLDADTLARHYQAALSVASGRVAASSCETLSIGSGARRCVVRVNSGDHGVVIRVDSVVDRSGGRPELIGSRVRLDVE